MSDHSQIKAVFREAGLRWTPQRQAIVETLWASTDHPTAEQIFDMVRRLHPEMSRATVYNTMEALAAVGQVETLHTIDGVRRYDPNPVPHHHLRCRGCARVVDLPASELPRVPPLPERLTPGFEVYGYRIEFQGLCDSCRAAHGDGGPRRRTSK
jgi:Fur family ferric uptake transcriptional regulator